MKTWISVLLLTGGVLVGMLGTPPVCLAQDAELLRKARSGDAEAQFNLGVSYANGEGVAENDAEAVKWYRRAAEQGNALAQSNLASMYDSGRGVPQDSFLAAEWRSKAVEQADLDAQNNSGFWSAVSVGWTRGGAEAGDADDQYLLGQMYESGDGVGQNDAEAVKWYRKAAEQGNALAQHNLGVMYANGKGVGQNDVEAVKWTRKAAEQGYAAAQHNLGFMYTSGEGVAENHAEAVKGYRKAAEQGDADAQYNLGVMYANGEGVAENDAEAVKWYRRAAEQGHVDASNNLAYLLAVAGQDLDLALELAERAVRLKPGGDTLDTLGWVQLKRGDVNAAVEALRAALQWAPDSPATPVIQYHLAVALAKQGNTDEAKTLLQKSLDGELFAERPGVEAELARLESLPIAGLPIDQQPPDQPAPRKPLPARKIAERDADAPVITAPDRVEADAETGMASVMGSVRDKSQIASFMVGGEEVALGEGGKFTSPRYMRRGEEKKIELVAIDRHGNRSMKTLLATRGSIVVPSKIEFAQLNPNRSKKGRRKNPAAALVIGVEDYKRMPGALHARTDAEVFYDYARRALGIPAGRIILLVDSEADNIGIQDAVRRLGGLADGKTDLYVYFAGHGFASGKGAPYLLPHDGDARYLGQLVSRDDVFESLAALKARSVTVFLDTCYSGRGREGTQLAKGMRPLVIASSKKEVPEGFTVISAAASDEWSGDLPEAEHGLFSYYLMQGLGGEADADGDRAITVEELHGYVAENVGRQAARLGREQSPELFGERERVVVRY